MAFVLVDLLTPGRIDGLNMNQVAGFTDQVSFVGGTILDDHDPFEVNPEIGDPFLNSLFNAEPNGLVPVSKDFDLTIDTFNGNAGYAVVAVDQADEILL